MWYSGHRRNLASNTEAGGGRIDHGVLETLEGVKLERGGRLVWKSP